MSKPSYNIRIFILVLTICIAALSIINNTHARQIYKSIDAEGNVTYSSTPPKEATQTEKMNISGKGSSAIKNQDNSNIERIKNLSDEMEKERLQRQDDRAAANKKREEEHAKKRAEEAKKQAEKAAEPEVRYYPIYVPRHPHHGRPGRPRPEPRPRQPSVPR